MLEGCTFYLSVYRTQNPHGCNHKGQLKNAGLRSGQCRTPRGTVSCLSLSLCTHSCELHVRTSRLPPPDLMELTQGPAVSTKKQWWWGWIPGVTQGPTYVTLRGQDVSGLFRTYEFSGKYFFIPSIITEVAAGLVLRNSPCSHCGFSLFILFIKLCLDCDLWWFKTMLLSHSTAWLVTFLLTLKHLQRSSCAAHF